MGNQQLWYLVLTLIVVGVAILRGLQSYQEDFHTQQEDEMHRTLIAAAQRAQGWYRKPAALGGGNHSFAQISWKKINMNPNSFTAKYSMSDKRQDCVRLTATSEFDPSVIISYVVYADSIVAQ